MQTSRRGFLVQAAALLTAPRALASMQHVVLLGDSIFDNGSYTNGKPDVIAQLRGVLPPGWQASLLAVDGATTESVGTQLARLPGDATHLVLSVGGNNALASQHILQAPVRTTADALTLLARAAAEFDAKYRKAVAACMRHRLPLVICTIYNGNFPDRKYQQQVTVALTAFNDVIIRLGLEHALQVLELRQICTQPQDYANPIEPSDIGGAKIAQAIVHAVSGPAIQCRGACVMGAAQ